MFQISTKMHHYNHNESHARYAINKKRPRLYVVISTVQQKTRNGVIHTQMCRIISSDISTNPTVSRRGWICWIILVHICGDRRVDTERDDDLRAESTLRDDRQTIRLSQHDSHMLEHVLHAEFHNAKQVILAQCLMELKFHPNLLVVLQTRPFHRLIPDWTLWKQQKGQQSGKTFRKTFRFSPGCGVLRRIFVFCFVWDRSRLGMNATRYGSRLATETKDSTSI